MAFKFIHTSDWQIGKVVNYVDSETLGLLQEARLAAIDRIGAFAVEREIGHVLVAGDVYDIENPTAKTLNQPLERLRVYETVQWYFLPGNHDPHRPNGLWDRLTRRGHPENLSLLLESTPIDLDGGQACLLPAPLKLKHTLSDPTEYMNQCKTPDRAIRIGIGHGSVAEFGSGDSDTPNFISPNRPVEANLSYMALGDWHGQKQINSRCWYSGTPETDAFNVQNGGKALAVEIEAANAEPVVSSLSTGRYSWMSLSESIHSRDDIDHLENKLRQSNEQLNRVLLDLEVSGSISLEYRSYFQERIVESVSAAFCHLRLKDEDLNTAPTVEDLNQIDISGTVRVTAERLKVIAESSDESGRRIAQEALYRLFQEWTKSQQR